ncbi:MAG: molybdenum cofactor biosynthesis protein MoeB [Legionellales bacterium]|nr:molybdenum cofactor biosynthesis protein MoeB [Legionellales bacterium]|tara:strand:- start:60411 stop:61511 length:1101 start_codon:yes stop_codon:yes gene_type:complete
MTFTDAELQRYSRQFSLKEVGVEGQARLRDARVLCVGAGGLGSPILYYLAAAGVGQIGIVDDDVVDVSNLQRQILYHENNVGQAKVIAAKQQLLALNPLITVNTYRQRLQSDNADDLIRQYDVIIDGCDNLTTRYMINDACIRNRKPCVFASILRFEGQCSVFIPEQGPCYRCLFPEPPPPAMVPNCAQAGVLGVLPGLMGSIQATEAIKLILNKGTSLTGRLLIVDALTMEFRQLKVPRKTHCPSCQQQQWFTPPTVKENTMKEISVEAFHALRNNNTPHLLLDIREPYEYTICNLGGKLLSLDSLPDSLPSGDKDQLIIVHCKAGPRGVAAANYLEQQGYTNVFNLRGGILAWIKQIDNSLMSY